MLNILTMELDKNEPYGVLCDATVERFVQAILGNLKAQVESCLLEEYVLNINVFNASELQPMSHQDVRDAVETICSAVGAITGYAEVKSPANRFEYYIWTQKHQRAYQAPCHEAIIHIKRDDL